MKRMLTVFAVVMTLAVGCKKDDNNATPTPDPNVVATTNFRIKVTVPAALIQSGDKLSVAGGFATNAWDPVKTASYEFKKNADGTYQVDIPTTALPASGNLEYKVVRNATGDATDAWKFVEKTDKCEEVNNRTIAVSGAGGKTFDITVQNFRNTGTCGN